MSGFGGFDYLEFFGIAFMLGGAFFFFYRMLVTVCRRLPFLSERQIKGASTLTVTAAMATFFWIYNADLLTCDRTSQGLIALRHDRPLRDGMTGGAERYCNYYRDYCLENGQSSDSANWRYCLRK